MASADDGSSMRRREPASPAPSYTEEELRTAQKSRQQEREALRRPPRPHIPQPGVSKPQLKGAQAGGNLPNPPPSHLAQAADMKRRKRRRGGRHGRRGVGAADVVATAVPHIAGVGAAALPSQIGYPFESTRQEPWSADNQVQLSHMAYMARRTRDSSLMAEHRGPVLESLPTTLAPFGFGKDGKLLDIKSFQMTAPEEYVAATQDERVNIELDEYRLRYRQVPTDVGDDEAIAGTQYGEEDFEQLPRAARALFNCALLVRGGFQDMLGERRREWAGFSDDQITQLTDTTGYSGRWPDEPGYYFLRVMISALTTRHIQIAVYGKEGIIAAANGLEMYDSERRGLNDFLAITDVVRESLLDSIQRNFKEYLPLHATAWQQSMLIGAVVTAKVCPEEPPAQSDPAIGRIWHVLSLEPTIFDTDEAEDSTAASQPMQGADEGGPSVLISEPDVGLAAFGIFTRNRTLQQLQSDRPSGVFDAMIHLGIERSGPIGVYRTALVDPLVIDDASVDFHNPTMLDISQIPDGTVVACIGVHTQKEVELRGMQRPFALPQILQFCPIPSAEVESLLHGQPQFLSQLDVHKQYQFLKYYHSLHLALAHYAEHLERAMSAKARVVAPVIDWAITEVEPRIRVHLPVIAPRNEKLTRRQARRLAQNEDLRIRPDDMVRVLVPTSMHMQPRSAECQKSLLSGADVAWEHAFIGRCTNAEQAMSETAHNLIFILDIEFMAFDRPRLVQVSAEARKTLILEPVSRSSIASTHFRSMGSAWFMARLAWGRHLYADLSRKPETDVLPKDVDWLPPPRTENEGLVGDLSHPPGRTEGQGATNRSLLGIQQEQNELAPCDPQLGMVEFSQMFYKNNALCPKYLHMEMAAEDGSAEPVRIKPTEEQLALAIRVHGCRPGVVAVVGGAGSGKSTTGMMLAHDYLLRGRAPFKLGATVRTDQRRVLVVTPTGTQADAFTQLASRVAARQRRQPYQDESGVTHEPDTEFHKPAARENPIRVCRIRGERALSHMDDRGDIAPAEVRQHRPETYLCLEALSEPSPDSKVPVVKCSFNTLESTYNEYRRMRALEYGQPVPTPQYAPLQAADNWKFEDYETTHRIWRELKEQMAEATKQAPTAGHRTLAVELERAHFFLFMHILTYWNANVLVVAVDDLLSPLLRLLSQCSLILVDDAQMLTAPQMTNVMEYTSQFNWVAPRSQIVLFGNDNGPLMECLGTGDAFAATRVSTFTSIVRSMTTPCRGPDRPHARLAFVHALTRQFRLPKDIAAWASRLALGAVLPEPHEDVWRQPVAPDFIHQMGVSSVWHESRRCIELIDMQSAITDVRHPLHGCINTVQHVFLMVMVEMARRCKSYTSARVMIVMVSREAAGFLREFIKSQQIMNFPAVYSPKEALGHMADLVILATTTIAHASLLSQALVDPAACRRLTAQFGAFADARQFLDLVQRSRHKTIILANLAVMDILQNETWQSLRTYCASTDSSSTASYAQMAARTQRDVPAMATQKHKELVAYLKYSEPVDVYSLRHDLDEGAPLEPSSPIHPLILHALNSDDSRARGLTPEARYALHLREAEGRCLEWRSRFSAAKVAFPKETPRTELTETEIKDGVFVALGSTNIFFAVSAPESHVRIRIAAPEVRPAAASEAQAPADAADSGAAAAAPAAEVVEEAEMPDVEEDEATRLNREAFDRQKSRYGRRGGQPQVLASTSTDPYGTPASAASSTPSSATTNVSSAGSSAYIDRECPRGSYLSGSVSSAALQLTQRTMRKEKYAGGAQPHTPSASAPMPKRQRTTESAESVQVLFPGTVTQDELMPPPARPAVGVLRGRSSSRQSGDQSGYPRQQSQSPRRSSAGAGRGAPQQTETEYTSLPESQGGVYMGRGGPPTFPPRQNLFATRSFHRGAGGGGGGGQQRRPFPPPIPERPTSYLPQRRPPTRPCSHCGAMHYDKQCTGPWDFAWKIQQQNQERGQWVQRGDGRQMRGDGRRQWGDGAQASSSSQSAASSGAHSGGPQPYQGDQPSTSYAPGGGGGGSQRGGGQQRRDTRPRYFETATASGYQYAPRPDDNADDDGNPPPGYQSTRRF